jgi:hypothetical protein
MTFLYFYFLFFLQTPLRLPVLAKKSRRLFALSPYYRSQKIADAYSKWKSLQSAVCICQQYIWSRKSISLSFTYFYFYFNSDICRGRHGCDRMVGGFTTTYAISAYHHKSCEFEPHSWQGVLDTTLCNKVYSDKNVIILDRFDMVVLMDI